MSKKTPDELSTPYEAKRIYNWLQSQLSIARFYGGIKLNGVEYVIRYDLEGQPLEEVKPKVKARKQKVNTRTERALQDFIDRRRAAIAKAEGDQP